MFKVYQKGDFYCEMTGTEYHEREFFDSDISQEVLQRDGLVMVVTHIQYDEYDMHVIEDDEDDKYRVERLGA